MQNNNHTVVSIDMGQAGFGANFSGTMIPSYAGLDASAKQWLPMIDPDYVFDQIDVARLMIHAWGREHERPDHRHRKGVYLYGPTGSGKTSMIEQFFARLNVPLMKVTWTPRREADDLLHSKTLVDGTLLNVEQAIAIAARNGYPVLIDEVDIGDPAEKVALNEVIERGLLVTPGGETLRAERGFFVSCTGNTAGAEDEEGVYHGTTSQNAAFLRRFFAVRVAYPEQEAEFAFLKSQFPNESDPILDAVARSVTMLRQAYEGTVDGQRLSASISRPETIDWVGTMQRFHYLTERGTNVATYALGFVFSNRLPASDQKVAHEIVSNCFSKPGQMP